VSLPGQASSRVWRVCGLSTASSADTTFRLSSSSSRQQQGGGEALQAGATVSVAQHFKAAYGLELSAPQLPCVDVGRRGQHIWYPLELCR
jgi:hypothetical protein